jgi:hypothetical protein
MARLTYLVALPCLFSAAPALAQRLGGGGGVDVSLTRIAMALILCLMIAALAVLLLKRNGGRIDLPAFHRLVPAARPARRIDVIETRRVSQYADVCLLRCDGREYLILCAQQQQTLLREAPTAETPS